MTIEKIAKALDVQKRVIKNMIKKVGIEEKEDYTKDEIFKAIEYKYGKNESSAFYKSLILRANSNHLIDFDLLKELQNL